MSKVLNFTEFINEQVTATGSLLVSDTLSGKNIHFDVTKETVPFTCTEEGCAQWVSNNLSEVGIRRQGNAWHAMLVDQNLVEFSAMQKFNTQTLSQMARIFSYINRNPKEKVAESQVKTMTRKLIPDQTSIKSLLNVNDIVGLYYSDSHNFTKAFFEGATGHINMGSGAAATEGPFFVKKSDSTPWTQADLGKNLEFVAGNSLKGGKGFGFNTHLGYVGAIANGEPIIFHNVHQKVYSTPFSKMSNIRIMWVKKGEGNILTTTIEKYLAASKKFISGLF